MLANVGLASAAFSQAPTLVANGGLYQPAAVSTGFTWLTALRPPQLAGDRAANLRRGRPEIGTVTASPAVPVAGPRLLRASRTTVANSRRA